MSSSAFSTVSEFAPVMLFRKKRRLWPIAAAAAAEKKPTLSTPPPPPLPHPRGKELNNKTQTTNGERQKRRGKSVALFPPALSLYRDPVGVQGGKREEGRAALAAAEIGRGQGTMGRRRRRRRDPY